MRFISKALVVSQFRPLELLAGLSSFIFFPYISLCEFTRLGVTMDTTFYSTIIAWKVTNLFTNLVNCHTDYGPQAVRHLEINLVVPLFVISMANQGRAGGLLTRVCLLFKVLTAS